MITAEQAAEAAAESGLVNVRRGDNEVNAILVIGQISACDGILHDCLHVCVGQVLAQRVVVVEHVGNRIESYACRNVNEGTIKIGRVDQINRGVADVLTPEIGNLAVLVGEVAVIDVVHRSEPIVHDGATVVRDGQSLSLILSRAVWFHDADVRRYLSERTSR